VCPSDGDFLACFWPLTDAHLRLLFRPSDMPNKTPKRMPYGRVAPHYVAHILGACTATIWAMAGALGDTIPVLSHGQNVAQAQHSLHTRTIFLGEWQHSPGMQPGRGLCGVDFRSENMKGAPRAISSRVGLDLSNTPKWHVLGHSISLPV
jgi:hypothetical protein